MNELSVFVAPAVDLGDDQPLLMQLVNTWLVKHPRNVLRSVYYDGEAALKDFGIAVPPAMARVGAALGWVAKGVHAVTDRSQFEGFVTASGADDPLGLEQIVEDNRFLVEFPAATVSSGVHGCSFLTVSHGAAGEPDVLVIPRAAEDSAAVWDRRTRSLKGFLSITDVDSNHVVNQMIMYTRQRMYTLNRDQSGWTVDVVPNPLGMVPVAPLVHKYELRRPLGHSRITRAAMYYSDAALRTIVRSEASAEFYSADSFWLFGADVTKFVGDDKWSAVMGRIKALDIDDGEDKPDLHRFNGASPQPHVDQLRMWANLFADDQDLEVKFADSSNPSSADAIFAAKETLITTTRDANLLWGHGAVQAMQMAVMLRDGLSEVPAEMKTLRAQFTDPAIVSPSARADAFSKLAAGIEGFGSSEVGMEYAGLTREQIVRFQAEQRRSNATSRIAQLTQAVREATNGNSGAGVGVQASEPVAGTPGAA